MIDLAANGLLDEAQPQTCWERSVETLIARKDDIEGLAVWCEAAVDGIVWYDRDGAMGRRLGEVRRAIGEGAVVRAFAHGQPYWKGAA